MARPTELAHGDDFFSPFIAPGKSAALAKYLGDTIS